MEDLLIYGAQYYRFPTPQPDQWARDMANMHALGFNTVRFWAQWRSNAPREGVYDFSDLRRLMDLAQENGLRVIINIIMDLAPAWLFRKYPDSIMVLANGEKLHPQAPAYRQLGGAPGPCFHHPEAAALKYEFIHKLAEALCDHPALMCWDLWCEPELTCGLARPADAARMACYCENSLREFKAWLQEKYGTVQRLNAAWQRCYQDFDEVEPPIGGATFKDMIDWRLFFTESLTRELHKRVETVRSIDSEHPVMVHTVPMPYFNIVNCCCDDYAMARACDLYGNSIGNTPLMASATTSAAAGKRAINAELHIAGGETFLRQPIHSMEDFRRYIYVPLARGIKGFLYWQFRAELCGKEGPAWGLTNLDGTPAYRAEYAARIGRALHKHERLLLNAQPRPAEIAIIRDYSNEIFSWCSSGDTKLYFDSIEGAFTAFHDLNYNVDVITTQQMLELGLRRYKLVYYPMPYYMSEAVADCLRSYVHEGGTLVSEANFGAYRDEVNLHSTCVPGYGFDEVFGVREGRCTTTASLIAAYGKEWEVDGADRNLLQMSNLDGSRWKGYLFLEELLPIGAQIRATYSDGQLQMNVLSEHAWGKGRALMCGSLPGAAYAASRDAGLRELYRSFADAAGVRPFPCAIDGIRLDLLSCEEGIALAIDNPGAEARKFNLRISESGVQELCEIESGDALPQKDGMLHISAQPRSVRIYVGYRV